MQRLHCFLLTTAALLGASSCSSGQESQKQVRFKAANGKYIGTVSGGKLLELTSRIGEQQLFTLIDLNGGDLTDGDAVQVKYVPGTPPEGGPAGAVSYWQPSQGKFGRGPEPFALKIKKLEDKYVFQTADGRFVAAPSGGPSPTLADSQDGALKFEIVDASAAPQANSGQTALAVAWSPKPEPAPANGTSIAQFGAVGDGITLNTEKIQKAIDHIGSKGGGTLVIPKGVFVSGALFLKPQVNLYLAEGAVLKGSTNIADFPKTRTRIEGQFIEWIPALINADKCNGLRITGNGTLDGNGAPFWEEFWTRYNANRRTKNLDVLRPRLALIQNSEDVQVRGVTFKDSAFWNLHLYNCKKVLVENVLFTVPNEAKPPSSDGTDIDSCQNVTIRGCYYRVNDDCIALKGTKGTFALEDKESLPVENIRVENCIFERGLGVVTLGSEATIVRNVVVENCQVVGPISLAKLKLRPDTPQTYEDIHYRNITLSSSGGPILDIQPWRQYTDFKGQEPPKSVVKNITFSVIKGRYGTLGTLRGNPGQTTISDITLENIDVQLRNETLNVGEVQNLKIENVTVNGKPFSR